MVAGVAPLIVIVGPTASGKSDLAMRIAKQYGAEIICADSRTIYKGLNLGTAKPSKQDQAQVPHHLLDIRLPNQPFSVAEFKSLAMDAIDTIWKHGKWPILVGGSGLYVDSVLFDFQFGSAANPSLRSELETLSIEELQQKCRQMNIELPENHLNKRYLIRAIERNGLLQRNTILRQNTVVVGIATKKDTIEARITERAREMVEQGVLEEVRSLGVNYGWDNEASKGNIYRIFREVVEDTTSLNDALQLFIKSDMRLVKKQLTWFKRNPYIQWGDESQLIPLIAEFVRRYSS